MSNRNGMPDIPKWPNEKIGAEYQILLRKYDLLKQRIDRMTINGLSPESRLSGYRVVVKKLQVRIKELIKEKELKDGTVQEVST